MLASSQKAHHTSGFGQNVACRIVFFSAFAPLGVSGATEGLFYWQQAQDKDGPVGVPHLTG